MFLEVSLIMVSAMDKRRNQNRRPVAYNDKNGRDNSDEPLIIMKDSSGYMTSCPMCEKRVFDVYDPLDKPTRIEIKCPRCRNIVDIPISEPPRIIII